MRPGPQIKTVAVLGAGTMGARIAAHFANAGVPCWLLDVAPSELTPEEKARGLELAAPPVAIFTPITGHQFTLRQFQGYPNCVSQGQLIHQARGRKPRHQPRPPQKSYGPPPPGNYRTPHSSGLPIHQIASGFDDDFQRHW